MDTLEEPFVARASPRSIPSGILAATRFYKIRTRYHRMRLVLVTTRTHLLKAGRSANFVGD